MIPEKVFTEIESIREKYPDIMIIFRRGDSYEIYGDDAMTAAKITGTTIATDTTKSGEQCPVTGFHFRRLDDILPLLVRAGHRVAICDHPIK